jgi:hypothetical protein
MTGLIPTIPPIGHGLRTTNNQVTKTESNGIIQEGQVSGGGGEDVSGEAEEVVVGCVPFPEAVFVQ